MPRSVEEIKMSGAEFEMLHAQLMGKDYHKVTIRQEAGVISWVIFDKGGRPLDEGNFT